MILYRVLFLFEFLYEIQHEYTYPSMFIDFDIVYILKSILNVSFWCVCIQGVSDPEEPSACQLDGFVPDCCCSYAAVERVNRDSMQPLLTEIVKTPFFRYFKTDLFCECPLWPDDAMCTLQDCSVCECEPEEIPAPWVAAENGGDADVKEPSESCASLKKESELDKTIQPSMRTRLTNIADWRGYKNPWMPNDNDPNGAPVEFSYINLLRNAERYTGYKGEHANRVWKAIYDQPCLQDATKPETPAEKRVFYKLISGLHSSISAHIVGDYLLDEATQTWGPNIEMFKARLGNPYVKDRVENLYFSYLFVLRAVLKAGPLIREAQFETGLPDEDARTATSMKKLLDSQELKHTCPVPFDEGLLWKGEDADSLRAELQTAFQNITRIMDCVGCEKCKMWGKLQLLGIATSLKILFSTEDCSNDVPSNGLPPLVLERNELIALINYLERLSYSVEVVRSLSLEVADGTAHPQGLGAISDLTKRRLSTGLVS